MCGIVGLIGVPSASREAFLGLTTLQHRGQDAAGILSYDEKGFHLVKNLGLVESVFHRENMSSLTGSAAIAHARYSTVGRGNFDEVQPFLMSYPYGIGLVHNGNLVNTQELRTQLRKGRKRSLLTESDTEALLNLFADELSKTEESADFFPALCQAVEVVLTECDGSFSVCSLIGEHGLVAFRDPRGIRPLMMGSKSSGGDLPGGKAYGFASESVALRFLGFEDLREVAPGEVVWISLEGEVKRAKLCNEERRPCMFEWVYFASPESEMENVPVYRARIELGRKLAKRLREKIQTKGLHPEVIIPVPETSRIAAIGLSEELNLPYRELLIKNRYIKRTFILETQEKRQKAVNLKLSPVRSEMEGKSVILVDDSIVRGTTSRKIVELVRQAGAREVIFVSTCPPIRFPCYYGIDFPDQDELLAAGKSEEEIETLLGVDAIVYQGVEELTQAIGVKKPCTACLTGDYPTRLGKSSQQVENFQSERKRARSEGGS